MRELQNGSAVGRRSKPSHSSFRVASTSRSRHKKKPSLHVSEGAVGIALNETQREEGMAPSCIVSSFLKLPTFLLTIVLQLQIDSAFGGWKIASALFRSLTRKTLPELCLVPPTAFSLRGFRPRSRFYPQRNKSIIPKIRLFWGLLKNACLFEPRDAASAASSSRRTRRLRARAASHP